MTKNLDSGGSQDNLNSILFKPITDVFVDEVSAAVGSLYSVAKFFGSSLMLIWKALLLKRRILFYSDVPVGIVCARVHACASLLNGSPEFMKLFEQPKRLYYVNLNDAASLSAQKFYVACTSEKIFESKKDMFDIFVDNQEVKILNAEDKKLFNPSARDHAIISGFLDDADYYDEQITKENLIKRYVYFHTANYK